MSELTGSFNVQCACCVFVLQSILYDIQIRFRILVWIVADASLDQMRTLAEQSLEAVSFQNWPGWFGVGSMLRGFVLVSSRASGLSIG